MGARRTSTAVLVCLAIGFGSVATGLEARTVVVCNEPDRNVAVEIPKAGVVAFRRSIRQYGASHGMAYEEHPSERGVLIQILSRPMRPPYRFSFVVGSEPDDKHSSVRLSDPTPCSEALPRDTASEWTAFLTYLRRGL
jgi:hypothetical protein